MRVLLTVGDVAVHTEWNDSETARKLLAAMPFEASGSYWGQEFYFPTPVKMSRAPDANDVVDKGAVAYWPDGKCLCLFWGPTPASEGGECRAASPVNPVGRVLNPEVLPRLRGRAVALSLDAE